MGLAWKAAMELRATARVNGIADESATDAALVRRGLVVVDSYEGFSGNVIEVVNGRVLALRAGLPSGWRHWLKAHALSHVCMHTGNQLVALHVLTEKQERQAQEFAGWWLWGDHPWQRWRQTTFELWELAGLADVPVECVEAWWQIVGPQMPGYRAVGT